MHTQLLETPSYQDLWVYRLIRIEGATIAAIRREFRLTRVQVAQAATRVDEFLLGLVPLQNATPAQRERAVSQLVLYWRMLHYRSEALEAYRRSLVDETIVETRYIPGETPQTKITTLPAIPHPGFLDVAQRASAKADRMRQHLQAIGWDTDSPLIT